MLQLRKVVFLYHFPRNRLGLHPPVVLPHKRDSGRCIHNRFIKGALSYNGALPVVSPHHVQQHRADILDPFIQVCAYVLQRCAAVRIQNHQRRGIVHRRTTHLCIGTAQAVFRVFNRLVDHMHDLTAEVHSLQRCRYLVKRLAGLQIVDPDIYADLV